MRLTLRTLLAYLDDTLEPAQTKLIGQKVAESPAAQQLIARIKEVVRRRRLAAPPTTGPGAKTDANSMAEYIDNVLPAEQLAEVEEVCLTSDVHLAEIAACHQILTVILSEPVLVPPTARQRMYGLVHGRPASTVHKPAGRPVVEGSVAAHGHAPPAEVPLSERPGMRRLAPLAAVFLLGAVLMGVIVFSLRGVWAPPHPASPSSQEANNSVAQANPPTARDKAVDEEVARKEKEKKEREAADALKEKEKTEHEASATGRAVPKKPAEAAPEPPPPATEAGQVATFVQVAGVPSALLRRRVDKTWQWVPDRSPVHAGEELVSLPTYRSPIRLVRGVDLMLWGDLHFPPYTAVSLLESAATLNENPDLDLDVTLSRGRFVVANRKAEGAARVRLRFYRGPKEKGSGEEQETWDLTLDDNTCEVLVDRWGEWGIGVPYKDPIGPTSHLTLIVLKGQAHLKVNYDTLLVREPPGNAVYVWDNINGLSKPQPLNEGLKSWITYVAPPAELAKELTALSDRLTKGKVDVVLSEIVTSKSKFLRGLGVFCLAATDNLPILLDALGDENNPDVRLTAVTALRNWMGRNGDQDKMLYAALVDKFRSGPAEIIIELLHTYSAEKLQEPSTWDSLISYLQNDNLVIRELANSHLWGLVPYIAEKIPAYNVAGGIDQREKAYAEWKKRIPDNKLPPPRPAATTPMKGTS